MATDGLASAGRKPASRSSHTASERFSNFFEALARLSIALLLLLAVVSVVDITLVPDWEGYRSLYLREGGWLRAGGRDPLFVAFISAAAELFGSRGYEGFRNASVAGFGLFMALLAFFLPRQRQASWPVNIACIGVLLASAFCLKSLVQIREGYGFVMILIALALSLRSQSRWAMPVSIALVIAATATHFGLVVAAAAVAGSWLLVAGIGESKKLRRELFWIGLSSSLVVAVAIALFLNANQNFAFDYFGDLIAERSSNQEATVWKLVYWLSMGALCFALHRQCLETDTRETTKFGTALAFSLSCVLLPIAYLVPLGLTLLDFPELSVTATLTRLLFTVMLLTAFLIMTTRSGNWITLGVLSFMLVDQVRTMLASTVY